MKNKNVALIGLIFLVVITSITTLIFSGVTNLLLFGRISGCTLDELAFIKKIMTSKDILKGNFYGEISDKEIYDGAMSGMLSALNDPYTTYLDDTRNMQLEELTEGKYEGVGIVVAINSENSEATILGIIEDSPAEKAELNVMDEIIAINGVECKGLTLEEIVGKMKVSSGSELALTINRNGEKIEKKIITEEIIIKSVYSEIKDDIGYIQITAFDEHTSSEFAEKYNELRSKNIKGLIVDLRDNGGGIFEEVVKIAQTLVPKGLIVYTEDKDGNKKEENSYGEGIDIPLVVLINEESASASEILAGAIKDRECGTLVGKKSFGKGVVQGWYVIGDGTSIKLTIAKYFTPNGVCIEGIGISPDIEVDNTDNSRDLQLQKALDIVKSKVRD